MSMPVEEVNADTKCPSVLGGRMRHYPRTVSGTPVTMPYLDSYPLGLKKIVMPSLCGNAHLVPPHDTDGQFPSLLLCTSCESAHRTNPGGASELTAASERDASAAVTAV